VIRTISDRADHAAPVDFGAFVLDVASRFGEQLVRRMFEKL
jgi:nucleoside phosphorylase